MSYLREKLSGFDMNAEELKTMVDVFHGLGESYADVVQAAKGTVREVRASKKLWRNGSNSRLIRLGLSLIVFPEPTPVTETVGGFLVAVGLVQKGIRHHTLYTEDVYKAFQKALKELRSTRETF